MQGFSNLIITSSHKTLLEGVLRRLRVWLLRGQTLNMEHSS